MMQQSDFAYPADNAVTRFRKPLWLRRLFNFKGLLNRKKKTATAEQPVMVLHYTDSFGNSRTVPVLQTQYERFAWETGQYLTQAAEELNADLDKCLHRALDKAFAESDRRIEAFTNWYFSYLAGYSLLWRMLAVSSDTSAERPLGLTFKQKLLKSLSLYLQQRFEDMVLKPEILEAELQGSYQDLLEYAENACNTLLSAIDREVGAFVMRYGTDKPDSEHTPEWELTLQPGGRFEYPEYSDAECFDCAPSFTEENEMIRYAVGKATLRGIFTELAAPFLSKALVGISGCTAGSIAGPLGSLLGAGVCIGTDWLINRSMAFIHRDEFVRHVRNALDTIRSEREKAIRAKLVPIAQMRLNHAIRALTG